MAPFYQPEAIGNRPKPRSPGFRWLDLWWIARLFQRPDALLATGYDALRMLESSLVLYNAISILLSYRATLFRCIALSHGVQHAMVLFAFSHEFHFGSCLF